MFQSTGETGEGEEGGDCGKEGLCGVDLRRDTVPVSRLDKRREKNMKASDDVVHESSVPRKSNTTFVLYCIVVDLGWANMVCNGPP